MAQFLEAVTSGLPFERLEGGGYNEKQGVVGENGERGEKE